MIWWPREGSDEAMTEDGSGVVLTFNLCRKLTLWREDAKETYHACVFSYRLLSLLLKSFNIARQVSDFIPVPLRKVQALGDAPRSSQPFHVGYEVLVPRGISTTPSPPTDREGVISFQMVEWTNVGAAASNQRKCMTRRRERADRALESRCMAAVIACCGDSR